MPNLRDLQDMLRAGMNAAREINEKEYREGVQSTRSEHEQTEREHRAFREELGKIVSSNDSHFELKEMDCPNCGATMKPNDFAKMNLALGAIQCPYCGSEVVLDDKLKDAEVIQETYLQKKKVDNEERRLKIEQDYQNNKNTLDTLDKINKGINNVKIGCGFAIIALILIIVLIIVF